jgi:hypothetical protein
MALIEKINFEDTTMHHDHSSLNCIPKELSNQPERKGSIITFTFTRQLEITSEFLPNPSCPSMSAIS